MRRGINIQYVYKIINKINNKFYVGRTFDVRRRWNKHINLLNSQNHHSDHFQNAWNKYPREAWEFKVFKVIDTGDEETDKAMAQAIEQHFLDNFLRLNLLYNKSHSSVTGSLKGKDHPFYNKSPRDWMSKEGYANRVTSYRKKSEAMKGSGNHFFGKSHTEETKQTLREKCAMFGEANGFYGKQHTEETKAKIAADKGVKYKGEGNPFYGKTHSEETRRKISEKNKGRKPERRSEKTLIKMRKSSQRSQPCEIDGVHYFSHSEAARLLGIARRTITYRIHSKRYENYKTANKKESVTTIESTS